MEGGKGTNTGPIFVGGAGRSGKTLVRWILTSHPRIVVTRRTEMWPRYYERFGDLGSPNNLERCLRAMLGRPQIATLEPDLERLRRDLRQGSATYARLFSLINEQYAERCGKPRWGDQTGLVERFADEIMSAYRGARIVHMVRDPRDRYEALRRRGRRRPGAAGKSTADWLTSVSLAQRNLERYPGSYKVVRYETLVARPEGTIREVCDFLGEGFDRAMLTLSGVSRYDEERAASPDGIPITGAFVGRYRDSIPRSDLAFIQATAAKQMVAFDYHPDPLLLTSSERMRYAASRPLSLARMRRSA